MKKIIFTTLACLLILVIQAQNETRRDSTSAGILKFGINHAALDLQNVASLFHEKKLEVFYIQYTLPLNHFAGISPRLFGGYWMNSEDFHLSDMHNSSSAIGASLAFTVKPVKWLAIDAGVVIMKLTTVNGIYSDEKYYYYESMIEDYKGLFASLTFPIINTSKIEAGARFEVMVDRWKHYHRNSLQGGIYLGVKL